MAVSKKIIIIGGGPAGLALATALIQNADNNITIIEKVTYNNPTVGEHLQAEAITLLESLKLPQEIILRNSTRCNGIAGSWGGSDFLSSNIFNAYGDDFIIHRPEFERDWLEHLRKNGVIFHLGSSPHVNKNNTVTIGSNTKLKYDFLIDCSGRTSRFHGSSRFIFDKMIGITFLYERRSDIEAKIIIESSDNGWWYHSQNKYRTVTTYFTDYDLYTKDVKDIKYQFSKTKIISKLKIVLCEKPIVKQCYTSVLKTIPNQIFQIGDAFYSLDPLSSQGIYKAMTQAIKVAELLDSGFSSDAISSFYESLSREFSETLKIRQLYYAQAYRYHKTDFFKRRILFEEPNYS